MQEKWDALWLNGHLATIHGETPYGIIKDGAIASHRGKIVWVGSEKDLPNYPDELAKRVYYLEGAWVTPGLIDCHTHIVYAGNRSNEFEKRLSGVSYAEIAKQGGGIHATVEATRRADEDTLFKVTKPRLQNLINEGVTTIEIKSGYGLDLDTEMKMLKVARRLGQLMNIRVITSFLGAHTIPKEYQNKRKDYLQLVCEDMIPTLAKEKLIDAVDVFCETIAFNIEETKKIFDAAHSHHLPVKIHAEQLSDMQGAKLAAEYGALSADHLEYINEESVNAMAEAGTVAVLLPGAFYYLEEKKKPPVDLLRKYKVPIAIATDSNPGSSPIQSLLLMLNMASNFFKLTPEESIKAITTNAAKALGLEQELGSLVVGKTADFVLWDIEHPVDLVYYIGSHPCKGIVRNGHLEV